METSRVAYCSLTTRLKQTIERHKEMDARGLLRSIRSKPILLIGIALILGTCTRMPTEDNEFKTCTAMGCFVTLAVALEGAIPSDFIVEVSSIEGESFLIHCVDGIRRDFEVLSSFEAPRCESKGALFFGFVPEEVTVNILWESQIISQDFKPSYEIFRPNGLDCPPECRVGSVTVSLLD